MALANTNSLNTNFFIDPYYDDFNEEKNFHRILFRPGQAVQARELTQIQSMLQNQIDRFAEHIFKEGTVVTGCPLTYLPRQEYVQIRDTDQLGNTINVSAFSNVQLTSSATGVTANTLLVVSGSESSNVKNTLYVDYTSVSSNGSVKLFQSGELITADNATKTANVITSSAAVGMGSLVKLGEGVIFAKDHFIKVPEQTVVVGEYSANASYRIGYTVNETIVTSADDTSLLDPAQGSFNYTAPGANRLKLTATLERKSLADTSLSNFVEILRIRKGAIEFRALDTRYSEIDNYIARRTFKESGHYVAEGMNLRLREHLNQSNNQGVFTAANGGNTSQLVVDVSPGTAYVFGYEQEVPGISHVALDKGLDFSDIDEATATTNFGNFVNVKNVVGAFDINSHNTVSLRNEFMNPIANNNFSIQNATGNEIGTARVRALDYVSGSKGSPDGQYKLYLYDVKMSNAAFTEVRSIQAGGTTANAKADVILSSGNAVASETNFNIGVFELPANAVRRLRDSTGAIDNSFIFNQSFSVTISSAGTFTLTTNDSNERFLDTGVQNATQKNQNFYVVLNGTATSAGTVDTGSMADGSNTISGLTAADTKFNIGERIALAGHANTFVISSVSATSLSTFTPAQAVISSQAITKVLPAGSVINMAGVGGAAASRSIDITSTTTADFDIKETLSSGVSATIHAKLNKIAAREKNKNFNSSRYVMINTSSNPGGVAGPWNLGLADVFKIREVRKHTARHAAVTDGIDVTSDFVLDNGQRDNLYSLASISKSPNSNLTITSGDHLLIKLDFFTEDTSQGAGYYSVDSYPIDDDNAANTTAITTAEIPTFVSPTSGDEFKLRDSIDIRPRITDTANNTTSLSLITTNPANTFAILEGTGNGLRYAYPNENFTVDLSFYLGRIDKVCINKEGVFRINAGTSSKSPIPPVDKPDSFTIGRINVSPYPSIITSDPFYRTGANSSILTYVVEDRIEGYTMADIGVLENRIGILEYYTSLNLLEQSTQSLQVTDGAGLNRFKSGFLVENFTDGYKADLVNQDFKMLIDADATEGIPREFTKFTKLNQDTGNSSGVTRSSGDVILTVSSEAGFTTGETISIGGVSGSLRYEVTDRDTSTTRLYLENVTGTFPSSGTVTGGTSGKTTGISSVAARPDGQLITLDYDHDLVIDNLVASGTRNATGAFWNWRGSLVLTPDQDFWIDTINLPPFRRTVTINLGTVIGGFNGTREISRSSAVESRNIESSEVQPFIRAQTIQFRADGMKPNSILYPYFDDVDVSSRVRPANSSLVATGSRGATLQAGIDGTVFGFFDVPNSDNTRFNTGERILRLSDNQFNSSDFGQFTTEAAATFVADGLIQEVRETIVTTRRVQTVRRPPPPPPPDRGGDGFNGGRGGDDAGGSDGGSNGGGGDAEDPVAQSFFVTDPDNPASGVLNIRKNPTTSVGMFLTKMDLFFSTKSSTYGVEISIREMDPSGNLPIYTQVPFGTKILQPSDINVKVDSPIPTPVYFDTPVYLLTDKQYCFVIKPIANNPDTTIWISRLGENDIVSGNRIVKNPYAGILFVSSNNRTWTAVQQEDVTFRAYFANFGFNQSGTLAITNDPAEYFNISTSNTDSKITRNMTVHGETTLVLKSTPTANVGELIVGATSNAVGTITSASSNTFTLKSVSLNQKFANNEVVNFQFANGLSTAGSHDANSTIFTATFPSGTIDLIDRNVPEGGRMVLTNVSGTFGANSQFIEQDDGLTGVINSITNLPMDEFVVNFGVLDLDGTTSSVTGKLATSTTTRDSTFQRLQKNRTTIIDNRKFILGAAQETSGIGGAKSADLRISLNNTINNRHSPAIDVGRLGIVSSEFFINNLNTNETSTTGGDATTRYISKVITLEDGLDAEDMRLLVTAYKPSVANIRVYGKFLNALDDSTIEQRPYEELTLSTVSTLDSKDEDRNDFKEFEYNMPTSMLTGSSDEYQYTSGSVTYTGYKYFKIKIVLTTSNTAKAPRLKNYRAIALQK